MAVGRMITESLVFKNFKSQGWVKKTDKCVLIRRERLNKYPLIDDCMLAQTVLYVFSNFVHYQSSEGVRTFMYFMTFSTASIITCDCLQT